MTEPVKREHPWLTKFQRAPDIALDELLRGIADIEPYERARPTDVLVMFFGGLKSTDPLHQSLDETLGAWLVSRRKDGPERRKECGLNSYIEELIQALSAIYRLSLLRTAESLRRDFSIFQRWLDSFYLGPGRDPSGELWRVMALTQIDRDFLKDWYRLCKYAGHILPIHYLSLGLLGLRMLPQDNGRQDGRLNPELLEGLFKWGATLKGNKSDRQAFLRQLRTIKVLYPRGPGTWRDILAPLVSEDKRPVFYPWLKGAGILAEDTRKTKGQTGTSLPPKDRLQRLLQRLKKEPVGQVLPDIRSLMEDYERYAEATGDDDPFVKSAGNFTKHLKKRAPHYALELVRAANRWQPYNPYLWSLWAQTLEILNKDDLAEVVYWEAIRRIPENVIFRNALANLLARTGRKEEAEKLFRDTMDRFPENVVCRTALADLLARTGRKEEAEKLFR
ncbi:MAG: tetratricopeptide repeat protein, partial [Deltaproteobacteria bacterium]|nr:tetratricopeptide repeat protein [Deltaproteobacteria bacterium]